MYPGAFYAIVHVLTDRNETRIEFSKGHEASESRGWPGLFPSRCFCYWRMTGHETPILLVKNRSINF